MLDSSSKEKDHRQDFWERFDNLCDDLERRIHALLDMHDIELMEPVERERVAIDYITLLLKARDLRMKYADPGEMDSDREIIDALYGRFHNRETNEGNQ